MKKTITLIFAASTLLFAGCCTTAHYAKWEYKVVKKPYVQIGTTGMKVSEVEKLTAQNGEAYLNEFGKDGWIYIKDEDGYYYFIRLVR